MSNLSEVYAPMRRGWNLVVDAQVPPRALPVLVRREELLEPLGVVIFSQ
jgi:hypothetical protein